ncbi:RcpC/CpaB family pilus assembly protein [Paludicola sp. MB14-C6]|uniref:Flp pilus assembly protein CpaB n=1 Tax=Paludihabitans sp. MB14-C6 TaxID=3070656 RepID=UPI0027DB28C7|nr:RcpC/CpaB family pilus assembly protein [Paludicola sp. MB14-C6]WMJ22871.1 RcpC/CpaB family pilus assembly protein [Paludicola sp. MB14-C6]
MKNRTVIGISCIILSIAVMFGVSPIINKMTSGKIEVIQLNKHMKQGQQITSNDVVKVTIGSYGIKKNVVKDKNSLIGKYTKNDLYPNCNIYPEMISDKADSAEDTFKSLSGTQMAISISISNLAGGVSGKLKNGDIVSVIAVNESESSISPELTYVKVITTTTAKGSDSNTLKPNEDGTTELPSTVTLLVNPKQAKLLANYEKNGKVHLALVYRGTDENAKKYLEVQNKVFENEVKTNG